MAFNSLIFLICFSCFVFIYYVIKPKYRYIALLLASMAFYSCWGYNVTLFLVLNIIFTYVISYFIKAISISSLRKKLLLFLGVGVLTSLLIYFKYVNYIINLLVPMNGSWSAVSIIMPVGLSFYIFKTISYLIDVYKKQETYEKNIFKLALYVSYFPQIVSGPIERSEKFFSELEKNKEFDYLSVKAGVIRMFWGFFKKLVIADNLALFVATVFDSYESIPGLTLFINSVLYSIQIYCDFSGYSDISLGMSKSLGMELIENFKQPYFATSLSDFWNRWHISLSRWLRDYIYIPLGGNRKGNVRKYMNIIIVFIVSGLWHGTGLCFLVWGLLHGLYQVIGAITRPVKDRILKYYHIDKDNHNYRLLKIVTTFLLVNFAWIFFRAPRLLVAIDYIKGFTKHFGIWSLLDGSLYTYGLTQNMFFVLCLSILIVFTVDLYNYHGKSFCSLLEKQNIVYRWCLYFALIFAILILGVYNTQNISNFIYGGF